MSFEAEIPWLSCLLFVDGIVSTQMEPVFCLLLSEVEGIISHQKKKKISAMGSDLNSTTSILSQGWLLALNNP